MNIFILDKDPVLAAQYHCDNHIRKLSTEMAQMLNMNSIYLGGTSFKRDYPPYTHYKFSKKHINHPCTKWLRESLDNSLWGIKYGLAVAEQFKIRYGKEHKTKRAIIWVFKHGTLPKKRGLTSFPICVREDLKNDDVVESYRRSYAFDKVSFAAWNKGISEPYWFKPYKTLYGKNK
jgi:hypothetical protein